MAVDEEGNARESNERRKFIVQKTNTLLVFVSGKVQADDETGTLLDTAQVFLNNELIPDFDNGCYLNFSPPFVVLRIVH